MGRAHAFIVPLLRDLAVSLGCSLIRACQHLREGRWFLSLRAERFEKEERKGRKPRCFRMELWVGKLRQRGERAW